MPSGGVIDPETKNPHYLCNQFCKHSLDFLLGKLRIRDFIHEPHFLKRIK